MGGYYDAGDNVKFGLPMAFTITMMSWSIVEYGKQMAANGELGHAMEAVKWGTDYLIKAHPHPDVLYGEVCALRHFFFHLLFNLLLIRLTLVCHFPIKKTATSFPLVREEVSLIFSNCI